MGVLSSESSVASHVGVLAAIAKQRGFVVARSPEGGSALGSRHVPC
jgi:hypothetical protein